MDLTHVETLQSRPIRLNLSLNMTGKYNLTMDYASDNL